MPHYAYLKLKMPGPRGVITVNGNTERSLRTEEHTAALAAEAQSSLFRQTTHSALQPPDTFKRVLNNPQCGLPALGAVYLYHSFSLSGPNSLEALSGSTIAGHIPEATTKAARS